MQPVDSPPAVASGPRQQVGDWSFAVDDVGLRRVTWRGVEVLQRVFVAARDSSWVTLAARVVDVDVRHLAGSFVWELSTTLDLSPGAPATMRLDLRFDRNELTMRCTVNAGGELAYNRVGLCLLHPLSQRGWQWEAQQKGGNRRRGTLPHRIAPQPLGDDGPEPFVAAFSELRLRGEVTCAFQFSGDLFEMEDQRNWTDASFKTYSTPLSLPRPHRLTKDGRMVQEVRLSVSPMDSSSATADDVGPAGAARVAVPEVGALWEGAPDEADLRVLADAVDFVRVELRSADPLVAEQREVFDAAARHGLGVRVVVLAHEDNGWDAVASLLGHPAVTGIIVVPADGAAGTEREATGARLHDRARLALGGTDPARVGGGTLWNLAELIRHDISHLRSVSFSVTPTVHASDQQSVHETLEALPDALNAAQEHTGGAAVHVGPIQPAERSLDVVGVAGTAAAGAGVLTAAWLEQAVAVLLDHGATSVCTLGVTALVREGELTAHGQALTRVRLHHQSNSTGGH